jgi:lipopolysaccharide/colanic/teichoic acid biosynthesis glycosyltransferase
MVMKNAVIAIFILGISSIFFACIARAIKLISKRMTIIFSTVFGLMENPFLISLSKLFSSDKNPARPEN